MSNQPDPNGSGCCSSSCGCGPSPVTLATLSRRGFIAATTAVAGTLLARTNDLLGAPIAGPFDFLGPDDFPIPADKKFTREWIASLTARGEPTLYRSHKGPGADDAVDELKYIGMPVGGICTGLVYLGGDGKLWLWDVFNQPAPPGWSDSSGGCYAKPPVQSSPIEQGFAIKVGDQPPRRLDRSGFDEITFKGTYPIGEVTYRDDACPARVTLEAFSPFIPLDADASGHPLTVLNYTVTNAGDSPIMVELGAWLENPVCKWTGRAGEGSRVSRWRRDDSTARATILECTAREPAPAERPRPPERPDIIFENWERGTYDGWTVTGKAFGDKPRNLADIAAYQGDLNAEGGWTVNTHETRHGEDVGKADTYVGTLTSRAFTIDRNHISFRIGGGNHPAQTCVNLLIDGAVVRTATGRNNNRMHIENWDVREFAGREAHIQIVDGFTGGWGQIGCDDIVFCDQPRAEPYVLREATDYGSIILAFLGDQKRSSARADVPADQLPGACFDGAANENAEASAPFGGKPLIGAIRSGAASLKPGESVTFPFVVAWHFVNPDRNALSFLRDAKTLRRHYATRFTDAADVLAKIAQELPRLSAQTRLWRDTWYDSTLPHWFLDRAFATVATAATTTCFRFDNGRFYGWEGTYCCAGTCTHVWQYGQSIARVFPALERSVREMIDFDQEFDADTGLIHYRGEAARSLAIDGQCGTILRAYREHTMCADASFLRRVWPNVKKAIEFVIARDEDQDGILDGAQYNTLDTTWWGQIAWISSLYLGVLRAGAAMGAEMGDADFAGRCTRLAELGYRNMPARLFNGEYFVHKTDPKHPEANSTGDGCHSDQLLGQTFAHQYGLPRLVPEDQARSALRSLYRYNFAPDIGPYRKYSEKTVKGGRWYAMPGEGGLIVCTWPKGGADAATGKSGDAWAAQYFNECWTGFEHHVASHMLYEGMVLEGLAVTRMLHDRHHAAKRNPYNEIECSNHYARAMAAFGSFLGICGYAHHGPSGFLAFDPRLSPENFRAAFIAATGWGSFRQTRTDRSLAATIDTRWGGVRLSGLRLGVPGRAAIGDCTASVAGRPVALADVLREDGTVTLRLKDELLLAPGGQLDVSIRW